MAKLCQILSGEAPSSLAARCGGAGARWQDLADLNPLLSGWPAGRPSPWNAGQLVNVPDAWSPPTPQEDKLEAVRRTHDLLDAIAEGLPDLNETGRWLVLGWLLTESRTLYPDDTCVNGAPSHNLGSVHTDGPPYFWHNDNDGATGQAYWGKFATFPSAAAAVKSWGRNYVTGTAGLVDALNANDTHRAAELLYNRTYFVGYPDPSTAPGTPEDRERRIRQYADGMAQRGSEARRALGLERPSGVSRVQLANPYAALTPPPAPPMPSWPSTSSPPPGASLWGVGASPAAWAAGNQSPPSATPPPSGGSSSGGGGGGVLVTAKPPRSSGDGIVGLLLAVGGLWLARRERWI